jgi:hypothetical protein
MNASGNRRTGPDRPSKTRTTSSVLAAAAVVWGVVLLGLAVFLPIDTPNNNSNNEYSLVHVHGYGILWVVGVPLATAVVVWALLQTRSGPLIPRWSLWTIWILSIAILTASAVGFLTIVIGIYVAPSGLALVAAAANANGSPRR